MRKRGRRASKLKKKKNNRRESKRGRGAEWPLPQPETGRRKDEKREREETKAGDLSDG